MNMTLDDKKLNIELEESSRKCIPKMAKFDQRRLQQVLLNLLSNAVKYSKYGKIIVASKMLIGNDSQRL